MGRVIIAFLQHSTELLAGKALSPPTATAAPSPQLNQKGQPEQVGAPGKGQTCR